MDGGMQDTSTFEENGGWRGGGGTDHDLMWGVHMWFG